MVSLCYQTATCIDDFGIGDDGHHLLWCGISREVDVVNRRAENAIAHSSTIHVCLIACRSHDVHNITMYFWQVNGALVEVVGRDNQFTIALRLNERVILVDKLVDSTREKLSRDNLRARINRIVVLYRTRSQQA